MLKSRIPEIARNLDRVPREFQAIAGELVVVTARANIHDRTGELARLLHAEHEHIGDEVMVWVIADAHAPPSRRTAGRGGTRGAPYGRFVEFGTHHASPHPFLVPALEANRKPIEKTADLLIKKACA